MNQVAKPTNTQPSHEELIQKLIAENQRLQASLERKGSTSNGLKVSAKGAVSVYGMGRFPITLYASQWDTLLAKSQEIKQFIEVNKSNLKFKEA